MDALKALAAALVGSFGFSMLYGLSLKYLIPAACGGILSWGSYLLFVFILSERLFFPSCLLATLLTALYADFAARKLKAPTTLFLIPAIIPLIPGSSLYYTFLYLYYNQWQEMKNYGLQTLLSVFAIAAGLGIAWLLQKILSYTRNT